MEMLPMQVMVPSLGPGLSNEEAGARLKVLKTSFNTELPRHSLLCTRPLWGVPAVWAPGVLCEKTDTSPV